MPQRSLGPVSTKYRMLSSQARANSGQHGSSPRAAVRRTLEQASVGASSCLLLDTARSPWAPAQAPRVARVATLGLSTPPVAMESQGWRAAAQLDVVEAGPLPCVACGDAGSRFPCIIVSYRDQGNTQGKNQRKRWVQGGSVRLGGRGTVKTPQTSISTIGVGMVILGVKLAPKSPSGLKSTVIRHSKSVMMSF